MDRAVNYYELKTELADLGFVEPNLVDDLRQAIFADRVHPHLFAGIDGVAFDLRLERDEQDRLCFMGYTASQGAGTPDWEIITFGPKITAKDAIETLRAPLIRITEPTMMERLINAGFDHFQRNGDFRDLLSSHQGPLIHNARYEREGRQIDMEFYFVGGQLAKLKATLIKAELKEDYLNGTDPAMLDRLMANTGWMADRHDPSDRKSPQLLKRYAQIDRELKQLAEGIDPRGAALAGQLMVKHWLGTPYDHRGFLDEALKARYTVSREYTQLTAIDNIYKQLNSNPMNTQNLAYLQRQITHLGFNEELGKELEKHIAAKTPEFSISSRNTYNKQNVDYELHYKAGSKDEMYFFNKYDAKVNDEKQTFYINNGQGITAKEAFNLLEGRAVYKKLENSEGQPYNAWLVLDKKNRTENGNAKLNPYTDNWNYKPERGIDKMDIVGIGEPGAREKLMKSLEKGNRHQVTAMKNGKETQLYIEANPADHRLNLTNYKGDPQRLDHYKKPEFKNEQKADKKESQKQAASDEGTKKKRSKGQKMTA